MIEMEVAHRDDVHALGVETSRAHGGDDRRSPVLPHRPGLLVDPFPDPRFHEDASALRLHHEAVERLKEPMFVVDLVDDQPVPEQARNRPEQRSRIRAKGAGLDQRHPGSAAQVGRPVDRLVQSHRTLSASARSARRGLSVGRLATRLEIRMEGRGGGFRLALVFRSEPGRTVRSLDGR